MMWLAPTDRLRQLKKSRRRMALAALTRRALAVECLEQRALLSLEPVSIADALLSGRSGDGNSLMRQQAASISADGQLVVFQSTANDLVANDNNQASNCACALNDVFLFNRATGQTSLVSVNAAGTGSGDRDSFNPKISADGRFVLFESNATNLTATPGGATNVYVRDLQSATTLLVSVGMTGTAAGNSNSQNATLSSDGRFVAFESYATNLVAGDANGRRDIFVRDLVAGTTTLVSNVLGGTASGNGESFDPRISDNGRFVAFGSLASDLVANDGTNIEDIFVRDLQTGTTELISIDSSGVNQSTAHNQLSPGRAISADGRYILFETRADNLFPISESPNVFMRDRQLGTTTAVSVHVNGSTAVGGAGGSMTPDGRFVAFVSAASNLVAGITDGNAATDVFLRDMQSGTTRLVSANAAGTSTGNRASGTGQYPFDFSAGPPSITPDGRFVAFASEASDLAGGVTDANDGQVGSFGTRRRDVFVRDMLSNSTSVVSINRDGTASGNDGSYTPAMSSDGETIAFESYAADLVGGQDNLGDVDIFVRDRAAQQTQLASHRSPLLPDWRLKNGPSEFDSATPDGRFVSFRSGGVVYVRDRVTALTTAESFLPNGTPQPVSNVPSKLSADGRYIAFVSNQNLATIGPPNSTGQNQVWLRDRETGLTRVVTLNTAGQASAGSVWEMDFSRDGRTIAFSNEGTDLVSGFEDGNGNNFGLRDVYIRDLVSGVTRLVSHVAGSDVHSANSPSYSPVFSDDGSKLIFQSRATDFIAGATDLNGDEDVFVYDVVTGSVDLVSVNLAGTGSGNRPARTPVISRDGRYVAFSSTANDLAPSTPFNTNNVYRRDLVTSSTSLVSVTAAGQQSNAGSSFEPSMSSDGRYIAFTSNANDLVAGDTGQQDVFVRDMLGGQTKRISETFGGGQSNGLSSSPIISPDGQLVSFFSAATNLVPNFVDGNGPFNSDLFVREVNGGVVDLVSVNNSGTASGNANATPGNATRRQFSGDRATLFFTGAPSDLIIGDRNFTSDVFGYQFNQAGQIRGHLFNDDNQNGSQETGESGLAFWTVFIDADSDLRFDADEAHAQTDADGNFAFTGLPAGRYSIGLLLPDGYSQIVPANSERLSATLASGTDIVSGLTFAAAAAQVDLQVTAVNVPVAGALGREVTVSWSVRNLGADPATGDWQDAVYLSQDENLGADDVLVAVVPHTGGLAAGNSYTASASFALPPQPEGGFRFIVETDRRRQVATDDNRANNVRAGDLAALSIPQLVAGEPHADEFTGAGQSHYYQFTVTPGKSLVLKLDSAASGGTTELFLRRGALPTPWEFDFNSRNPSVDQTIYVPATQAGIYYVMATSRAGAAATASYTLTATLPGLKLDSVATNVGGNRGRVTVKLQGAGFTPNMSVQLLSGNAVINASAVEFRSASLAYATFNLNGKELGHYDVRVSDPGRSDTQSGAFEVVDEGANDLDVDIQLLAPSAARAPTSFGGATFDARPRILVTYKNNSKVDVPAPIFHLTTDIGKLSIQSHTVTDANGGLTFLGTTADGPAGYLRPGAEGRIEARLEVTFFIVKPVTATITLAGSSTFGGSDYSGISINWLQRKDSSRPSFIPQDAWEPVWANLVSAGGTTYGDFQQVLNEDATYLGQFGEDTSDLSRLMGFEIQKANASLPVPVLAAQTDAAHPAAQLDLSFGRMFLQPISGRYRLGPLGRGWAHDWEVQAVNFSTDGIEGTRIDSPSGSRYFYRQTVGTPDHPQTSYTGDPGDPGEIINGEHGIAVREPDGTITAFRGDGKLDYLQDVHGVRITAGYDAGQRLISLTHSTGPAIAIAYNDQGRISQVTDPAGRSTTYSYDPSGEHLVSVSDNRGTTEYSYILGQGAAREHALASIAYPGGTHQFFHYDDRGRLVGQEENNGANAIAFSYEGAGGVTVTDANNSSTTLLYNSSGQLEEVRDALGRRTDYQYNDQQRLSAFALPSGSQWHYDYDDRGHVTQITNPLGQSTQMQYEPTKVLGAAVGTGGLPTVQLGNYRMTRLIDARGNSTQYDYGSLSDSTGDVRSITYPNHTKEQFTYDPLGNVTQSINRREHAIGYAYDTRGLLLSKTYADGAQANYVYDDRGNMLTATDDQGVTAMTYDNADRLMKISYPGGRFLQFTFDAGGRRTSSVDQDGFTINYQYDAVGRLVGLRDSLNAPLVTYTYDAAGYLTRKELGNGTFTTFDYDAAGQLLSLVNHAPDGSVNSHFDYAYDADGHRTSVTSEEGTTQYSYDALGQLVSALLPDGQTVSYQYDEAGNYGGTPGNRDPYGRFTPKGFNSVNQNPAFAYDADGNLINKGIGSQVTYAYDDENRLISSNGPDGQWHYEYDALGNRIAVVHDGLRTQYMIDPVGLGDVVAEYGTSGLISHYVHGFGLISRIEAGAGGGQSFYDFDAVGNAVGLTNAVGSYVNRYHYSPFGQTTTNQAAVANPFQFAGEFGVMVAGGGLNFMRARFYDPVQGQFLSDDPIGLLAGDANLRRYVANQPTMGSDPSGLIFEDAIREAEVFLADAQQGRADLPNKFIELAKNLDFKNSQEVRDLYKGFQDVYQRFIDMHQGKLDYFNRAAKSQSVYRPLLDKALAGAGRAGGAFGKLGSGLGNLGGFLGKAGGLLGPLTLPFQIPGAMKFGEVMSAGWDTPEDFIRLALIGLFSSFDPNDIQGPAGYGAEHFVGVQQPLSYRITFENDPEKATAPAQEVFVQQQLDPDLDWSSLELLDFGFGPISVPIPGGQQSYRSRVDYQNQDGSSLFVDFSADFNPATGLLSWSFRSVDPLTGVLPPGVFDGFLPVNDETHRGEGFVTYVVRPKSNAATGTRIDAQAEIVFDINAPINTPSIFNTVDAGRPQTAAVPLPSALVTNDTTIQLDWTGQDDAGGSGVASYTVLLALDDGPFAPIATALKTTTYALNGQRGHKYSFRVLAEDNVNQLERKSSPDALTVVLGPPWQNAIEPLDTNGDGQIVPLDLLLVINELNSHGLSDLFTGALPLPPATLEFQKPAVDVNGDNFVTAIDALLIINYLNTHVQSGAGESPSSSPPAAEEAVFTSAQSLAESSDTVDLLSLDIATLQEEQRRRTAWANDEAELHTLDQGPR